MPSSSPGDLAVECGIVARKYCASDAEKYLLDAWSFEIQVLR